MTRPGGASRRVGWAMWAVAAGAVGLALALPGWVQPSPGSGFRRELRPGCGEPRVSSWGPEPVELRAVGGCVRWEAHLALDRARVFDFVLESEGQAALVLDGARVIDDREPHGRRERSARRTLDAGVHTVVVEGGPALRYLRLFERDRTGPYNEWIPAPLDRARYYRTPEDAHRALAAGRVVRPERMSLSLLFAALLALGGTLAWLAWRARRGSAPWQDALVAALLGGVAVAVRAWAIPSQDVLWDELAYLLSGDHMVRNAMLGDWSKEAFRFNFEHPPVAKWIYGVGGLLGGHAGARALGAALQGAAVAFTYGLGRLLFRRPLVAATGAGVLCFLPHVVGHGRLSGLESPVLFFTTAATLAIACWVGSIQRGRPRHGLIGWAALLAVLGMGARMTAIWTLGLVFLVGVGAYRRALRRGLVVTPIASAVGVGLGVLVLFALWPWLWDEPFEAFKGVVARWGTQHPTEYFEGVDRAPPPARFYAAAFLATTPESVLALALLGAAAGLSRRRSRAGTWLVLGALLLPFGQSLSSFRQDLARYVVQAWPALALVAALGVEALGRWAPERWGRWRNRAGRGLALALVGHVAVSLALVEPYPLDYFNDAIGGPYGVFRDKRFELAWWGEGIGEAVRYVNRVAPDGATVRLEVEPRDTRPPLRADLRATNGAADFVVANHYKFRLRRPAGCATAHRVTVRGAPLVEVFDCRAHRNERR